MKHILLTLILCLATNMLFCTDAEAVSFSAPDIGVPGVRDGDEIPDWLVRWELAKCLAVLKRYDEAIADYKLLLKEKPGLKKAKIELAQVLLWHGEAEEAEKTIRGIEAGRLEAKDRIIIADIYTALKKYDLARPLYRAALEARPEDHETRLKLAEMLSWNERYDESLAEYRIILNDMPEDTQIRRKYAMVLIWSGRHEKAVPELRRTLE